MRRQPIAARFQDLAGEHLDAVAADRLERQRHDALVDLGTPAAVADIGMNRIGEIEHGRTARQVDHLALRRQQVDAILDNLGAEAREQGRVIVARVLAFQQLAHPGDFAFEARIRAAAFLVAPVRSNTEFGVAVHLVRADLHFQRLAFRPDHGRVQRLVVIAFRLAM